MVLLPEGVGLIWVGIIEGPAQGFVLIRFGAGIAGVPSRIGVVQSLIPDPANRRVSGCRERVWNPYQVLK